MHGETKLSSAGFCVMVPTKFFIRTTMHQISSPPLWLKFDLHKFDFKHVASVQFCRTKCCIPYQLWLNIPCPPHKHFLASVQFWTSNQKHKIRYLIKKWLLHLRFKILSNYDILHFLSISVNHRKSQDVCGHLIVYQWRIRATHSHQLRCVQNQFRTSRSPQFQLTTDLRSSFNRNCSSWPAKLQTLCAPSVQHHDYWWRQLFARLLPRSWESLERYCQRRWCGGSCKFQHTSARWSSWIYHWEVHLMSLTLQQLCELCLSFIIWTNNLLLGSFISTVWHFGRPKHASPVWFISQSIDFVVEMEKAISTFCQF